LCFFHLVVSDQLLRQGVLHVLERGKSKHYSFLLNLDVNWQAGEPEN